MRAKALGQAITELGKGLGLKVTTHSFRRVSATQLVAAGVDVDTAARRLGHTKEVMLASYVLGDRRPSHRSSSDHRGALCRPRASTRKDPRCRAN